MTENLLVFAGNLVRDPEMRHSNDGKAITNVTVASSRKWKGRDGKDVEDTVFLDAVAFGKTGETIAERFRKGDNIYLKGRLKQDTWEDKQSGQKRTKIGMVAEGFQFTTSKSEGGAPAARRDMPTTEEIAPRPAPADDDVPF